MNDHATFGEGYEVARGPWWGPIAVAAVFAVLIVAIAGVLIAVDREPDHGPDASWAWTVVRKGCKCRHELTIQPQVTGGWMWHRDRKVSLEDWEWAREGDAWPLPPPESRPVR